MPPHQNTHSLGSPFATLPHRPAYGQKPSCTRKTCSEEVQLEFLPRSAVGGGVVGVGSKNSAKWDCVNTGQTNRLTWSTPHPWDLLYSRPGSHTSSFLTCPPEQSFAYILSLHLFKLILGHRVLGIGSSVGLGGGAIPGSLQMAPLEMPAPNWEVKYLFLIFWLQNMNSRS